MHRQVRIGSLAGGLSSNLSAGISHGVGVLACTRPPFLKPLPLAFRLTESMHRQVLDVMRREGCTDESEALRRLLYRGLKATAVDLSSSAAIHDFRARNRVLTISISMMDYAPGALPRSWRSRRLAHDADGLPTPSIKQQNSDLSNENWHLSVESKRVPSLHGPQRTRFPPLRPCKGLGCYPKGLAWWWIRCANSRHKSSRT